MTRAEIIADLKVMIGNGIEVSDGQLYQWVNDGYAQLIDEAMSINPDYFIKTATISTTTTANEYSLPADWEKISMVSVLISGTNYRLKPVDGVGFDANVLNNTSYTLSDPRYYLIGNKIGLLPIPSEVGTNNMTIWYVYTPAELTTDQAIPAIPSRYHGIIKYWAYANYLDRDDDHVAAERMRQRFDSIKDKMSDNMFGTQNEDTRSVTIVNNRDYF